MSTTIIHNFFGCYFAILLALSLLSTTSACSCAPDQVTFASKFEIAENVDIVYVYGQINVSNGRFAGFIDDGDNNNNDAVDFDINADIYYLGYRYRSYKGCSGPGGVYTVLSTGGNSGLCGVRLDSGWHVFSSNADYLNPEHQRLGSCGIIQRWENFSYEEYSFAESNAKGCDA